MQPWKQWRPRAWWARPGPRHTSLQAALHGSHQAVAAGHAARASSSGAAARRRQLLDKQLRVARGVDGRAARRRQRGVAGCAARALEAPRLKPGPVSARQPMRCKGRARLPSPAAQANRLPSTRRHCSTAWACCTCYLTLTRPTAGARQSAVCVVSSTRRKMPATRASRSGRPRSRLLICTNVQACMGVHASPSFSRLSPCRGAAALPACSLHEQPRSAGERISACRTGKHARCAARQAVW